MAISAFKHIRLSGYNLTPVAGQGSNLRLGFGNSGVAYYSELTGISGLLQSQIASANTDVSSIFIPTGNNLGITLQDGVTFTGVNGTQISVSGQVITFSGDSGYFQGQVDGLSNRLSQSGITYFNTFATQTNLALTGSALATYNSNYSGWANAEFVKRSTQQIFTTTLAPIDRDAYAIIYPVPYSVGSNVKVQANLEVPGDVMYHLAINNVNVTGYTGILSDNVLEANAKVHTFVST